MSVEKAEQKLSPSASAHHDEHKGSDKDLQATQAENAKLANPLSGKTDDELRADAEAFCKSFLTIPPPALSPRQLRPL